MVKRILINWIEKKMRKKIVILGKHEPGESYTVAGASFLRRDDSRPHRSSSTMILV